VFVLGDGLGLSLLMEDAVDWRSLGGIGGADAERGAQWPVADQQHPHVDVVHREEVAKRHGCSR